jgi:hypothetical protein
MTRIDTSSLSYAFIDAQPIDIDWDAARGEDGDGIEIHLPEITATVLDDHGHEPEAFDQDAWLDDNLRAYCAAAQLENIVELAELDMTDADEAADWLRANWRDRLPARTVLEIDVAMREAKEEHDEEALEQAVEDFKSSDDFYEWQDSYQPMMNALWPCEPRYGLADEDAATAIDRYAGATALVTINSEQHHGLQGIAMTGGGMDMSWDICAAYICCGCIPPIRLLADVPHFAGQKSSELTQAVLECMDLAADWLTSRAERLRQYRADTEKPLS